MNLKILLVLLFNFLCDFFFKKLFINTEDIIDIDSEDTVRKYYFFVLNNEKKTIEFNICFRCYSSY